MQKESYESDIDYYINITQDMYFSETLLASLIESTKHIKNKYYAGCRFAKHYLANIGIKLWKLKTV